MKRLFSSLWQKLRALWRAITVPRRASPSRNAVTLEFRSQGTEEVCQKVSQITARVEKLNAELQQMEALLSSIRELAERERDGQAGAVQS